MVGLGNPGSEYEPTRHNAGFWFVDDLARRCRQEFHAEPRFHSEVARCQLDGNECRLQKPLTFMNRSGQAVGALMRFFKIPVEQILVVHDELDLEPGTVRLKKGGGHGGHNGLRDLISHLGSKDFYRLRIGIGHPGHRDQVVDYVLKKPSVSDRRLIEDAICDALDVMPGVVEGQIEKAMHTLHTQK
ncbi:aminoacyl-tRNA hydrolase [Thiogranum longum]|uniref:aminoacyl-tRNA hydrolase n=1 Tax=Thiogranum longum TaxID=1537524 RepID=UPI001A9EBBCA|nr:aminoacyl-tRNA hydrolase [Thiogranum longum]